MEVTIMKLNDADHLMKQTIDMWQREDGDSLFRIKQMFLYVLGRMENTLSEQFAFHSDWVINDDVFIKVFDNHPTGTIPVIESPDSRMTLEVSFHKNVFKVAKDGKAIVSLQIDDNGMPIVKIEDDAFNNTSLDKAIKYRFKNTCRYAF